MVQVTGTGYGCPTAPYLRAVILLLYPADFIYITSLCKKEVYILLEHFSKHQRLSVGKTHTGGPANIPEDLSIYF